MRDYPCLPVSRLRPRHVMLIMTTISSSPMVCGSRYWRHSRSLSSRRAKGLAIKSPLLVSVRSGAKFSMPGMMDTVLNLGINDETVHGLIALTNDERFAYDAYRRFIQMFSKIVLDTEPRAFEEVLERYKE